MIHGLNSTLSVSRLQGRPKLKISPQIAEVDRHGFDLRSVQAVRNRGHDGCRVRLCRIETPFFAPVRQFVDGVVMELARQTGNFPAALSLGAVTCGACRDIGVGYSVLKDSLSGAHEVPRSAAERSRVESPKIRRKSRDCRR